ncbi:MAG: MATE family efflux transporter [Candidatus Polarisedimenticolia bacterium]
MSIPTAAPPAAPEPSVSFWQSAREAVAGTSRDFTEGSIGRAVALLSIPMVLEMSMESLFGILDVFFVARLGADAVATVGVTESLILLIFAIALGLCMATTAMVARRVGEKDHEAASIAAVQAIILGLLVALPLGLAGFFAKDLLRLMGAPAGVVEGGWGYTATMLGGNATILLLFLINAIFRGAGDASLAMRSLWLANIVNIVLDPCLIFGLGPFPEMGITGAAVGTTIGRGVGVAYQLRALGSGRGRVTVSRRHLRLQPQVMLSLLRVSMGGILQMLIATASWLGLVRILTPFGSAALAGYTIALRIIVVAILPSWGMSNAAATLVGQNLGAGKPERAERSVWLTGFYNMGFLGLVAVVFIVFAEGFIGVFTADPDVLRVGVDCLRYVSYGYVFYAWGMVVVQAFNGAGDTMTPTYINIFCYWLWQIPLAYGLSSTMGMGPQGVFLAITISESTTALVGLLVFRRGRWKTSTI